MFAAWVVFAAGATRAATINTGFDQSNSTRLADDAADSDWLISASPAPAYNGATPLVRVSPLPGGWMADTASLPSRWIVAGQVGVDDLSVAPGIWTFQTSFSLAAADPDTVLTGLRYSADNKVVAVKINGTAVFSQSTAFAEEFGAWHVLGDVGTGLFQTGVNVVQFQILNQEGLNSPIGLRVEGAVVPEPRSMSLICLILSAKLWRHGRS
jgi:hypothetical protein